MSALLDANTVGKNENYPIDLVYLWCEDNQKRKKQRYELKKKLGIITNNDTNSLEATTESRFVSNDELKYSLRSVEKYAPWINKIYIVTDNQVPKWLNSKHPKIKIIDHRTIMPESARPNFNSVAIELTIVNIPGLSEHFLYSNDDMMFGNNVEPGDFFKDGKPIYILNSKIGNPKTNNNHRIMVNNSYNTVATKFTKNYYNIKRLSHHAQDPYTKTNILKCNKEFKKNINDSINSRFRSNKDIQRSIYTYFSILNGDSYYKIQRSNILNKIFGKITKKRYATAISLYTNIHNIRSLPKKLEKNKYKMFCTNDTEHTTNDDRSAYKDIMEQIFPDKSSFEI